MFLRIFFIIIIFFFQRLFLDCKLYKHRMHVAIMRGSTCLFSMQKADWDRFRNSVSSEPLELRFGLHDARRVTSETKERFDIWTMRIRAERLAMLLAPRQNIQQS